jgi:hypothetical protein
VDERADAHLSVHLRRHRHRRLHRRLGPGRGMVSPPPLARSAPGACVRSRLTVLLCSASAGGSSSRGAASSEPPSRRPGSRRRTSSGAESRDPFLLCSLALAAALPRFGPAWWSTSSLSLGRVCCVVLAVERRDLVRLEAL